MKINIPKKDEITEPFNFHVAKRLGFCCIKCGRMIPVTKEDQGKKILCPRNPICDAEYKIKGEVSEFCAITILNK